MTSFVNSNNSRIVAAVLAVLLIVLGWMQFCKTSSATRTSENSFLSAKQLTSLGLSAKASECNKMRSAQIDQMVKDGFIKAEEVAKAKEQAFNLCIANREGQQL